MRLLRRFFGFVIVIISFLVVVFSAAALLRPEWVQLVYTAAQEAYTGFATAYSTSTTSSTGLPSTTTPEPRTETSEPLFALRPGKPIGFIEIPRLRLSSVVLEGEKESALLLGVGHLSDTPMPGTTGNSVLAAHRDTFFRPLKGIRRDDIIRFTTGHGEIEYVVRATKIVEPTDVAVLAPTSSSTLTLITCYPFNYIGPAPKRFVVQAERSDFVTQNAKLTTPQKSQLKPRVQHVAVKQTQNAKVKQWKNRPTRDRSHPRHPRRSSAGRTSSTRSTR